MVVLNLTDGNGCPYTATLYLNEYPVTADIVTNATVCAGDSYTWTVDGMTYTAGDSPVVLNLTDGNGCPYTATLNLDEYPVTADIVTNATVCAGDSYTWTVDGMTYTAGDSPVVLNLTDGNGCPYTATLNLDEYPVTANIVTNATVCAGDSYTWTVDGMTYTAGDSPVTLNLTDGNGCPYTATLNLDEYPVTADIVTNATVCAGDSYTWTVDGMTYTAGDSPVTLNLTDSNGCPDTATLYLYEYPGQLYCNSCHRMCW